MPSGPEHCAGIGVVGLSAPVGHHLLVAAYRPGRASDLAPLAYLSLVWSFMSGALLFHEQAQPRAIAGALAFATGGAITLRARPTERKTIPTSVDYGDPG